MVLIGCADRQKTTPAACLGGPDPYLKALAAAPAEVRLEGSIPISDCIVPNQTGGELAQAGSAIITAATRLNNEARTTTSHHAPIALGYLVGAVQKSAGHTGGIHADLVRRLDAAVRFDPGGLGLLGGFKEAFGTGYAAGQRDG